MKIQTLNNYIHSETLTSLYNPLQLQSVSFLRLTMRNADSPIDITYMSTSTPYAMTASCNTQGTIGKNTVVLIDIMALKKWIH